MEPKNFYLKAFNLATNLTDAQLSELGNSVTQKEGRRGQVIYAKGGDNKVCLLVSGKVKLSEVHANGDEMIKELVLPGDLFGDIMLTNAGNTCEYAQIVSERAIYFVIAQDQLAMMMKTNHSLTMNYMAKVNEKFRSLEDRYVNMVAKDVKSRLMYCFREWARKEGKKTGDRIVIKNSLTHGDLANLIATSRQTVTVILNEMKEAGKINYNRREIEFSSMLLAG
jgi:CRP/FNR family cyclic AMP-dependent transcriptional regulator